MIYIPKDILVKSLERMRQYRDKLTREYKPLLQADSQTCQQIKDLIFVDFAIQQYRLNLYGQCLQCDEAIDVDHNPHIPLCQRHLAIVENNISSKTGLDLIIYLVEFRRSLETALVWLDPKPKDSSA